MVTIVDFFFFYVNDFLIFSLVICILVNFSVFLFVTILKFSLFIEVICTTY